MILADVSDQIVKLTNICSHLIPCLLSADPLLPVEWHVLVSLISYFDVMWFDGIGAHGLVLLFVLSY